MVEHPRARSLIPSVRSAVRPVTCVSVDKFNAIEALIATTHLILSRKFDLISIVSDIFLLPRTISLTAMAALTYFSTLERVSTRETISISAKLLLWAIDWSWRVKVSTETVQSIITSPYQILECFRLPFLAVFNCYLSIRSLLYCSQIIILQSFPYLLRLPPPLIEPRSRRRPPRPQQHSRVLDRRDIPGLCQR